MGALGVVIKRISPNIFVRIYNGKATGISVFLGVGSVIGLFFAIYKPMLFDLQQTATTFFIMIVLSSLVAYFRGQQKLLPNTIIDELSTENKYKISFCDNQSLREADEMTKPYFGSGFIPFDKIEQWRLRNTKGFVQITNAESVLCACFVILGLEPSFLDQFIAGRLTEHDMDSNVILPFDEMKKQDRIYISGVVVRNPGLYMGHKRAVVMLWAMLQYIKKIFGLRKARTFYAVGLTNESEKLLNTMGFTLCGNKKNRKDKSNLYRIDLDKNKWNDLIAKIGDYSKMASLEID